MKLQRPKFSTNIDADVAIGVIDRNIGALTDFIAPVQSAFVFNGMHNRTAKGDELSLMVSSSLKRNSIKYQLKRDSLYHILPEYLFHPLDRYADNDGGKTTFLEKRAAQIKIENEAKEYFYPFDKSLNNLRVRFQNYLNDTILCNEAFIVDFLSENEDVNKDNPFIAACLPHILSLRANRGSDALINLALKKAFEPNLIDLSRRFIEVPSSIDDEFCHITLDGTIDDLFCGNYFVDWVEIISIKYQAPVSSSEAIIKFTEALNEFSIFFKRWFLSDRQEIKITFGDYLKPPVLCNNTTNGSLFLNYNTQLLVS